MAFKVEFSGWYRTRGKGLAEVVVTDATASPFVVVGYVVGEKCAPVWRLDGRCSSTTNRNNDLDLVEYIGKERPKDPKKFEATIYL